MLSLRRVRPIPPREILYSLPTIADRLPAVDTATRPANPLVLHEDDWRQVEFVPAAMFDDVAAEFQQIRAVLRDHAVTGVDGSVVGLRKIHIRERPTDPLTVPTGAIDRFPRDRLYDGVGLDGGAVIGSFAFGIGPLSVYGTQGDRTATVVGVEVGRGPAAAPAAAGLARFARDHGLLLVDWCRCVAVGPDSISDLLRAS